MRSLARFIWPQRSILSGERHPGDGAISPEDFARLHFLNGVGCARCAAEVEIDLGADNLCGACAARPPAWNQARAAIAYDDMSRQAILDLKYAARRDGLQTLINWMVLAGQDVLAETDYLVPVPLHYRRLARRGFNQAGWLASGIARQVGTGLVVDGLKRTKPTRSQAGLSARQRRRNVAGAFAARASAMRKIAGSRLTLVDDVYTTGSTLTACTAALKKAGAEEVNVLVLARVVKDTDVTI